MFWLFHDIQVDNQLICFSGDVTSQHANFNVATSYFNFLSNNRPDFTYPCSSGIRISVSSSVSFLRFLGTPSSSSFLFGSSLSWLESLPSEWLSSEEDEELSLSAMGEKKVKMWDALCKTEKYFSIILKLEMFVCLSPDGRPNCI